MKLTREERVAAGLEAARNIRERMNRHLRIFDTAGGLYDVFADALKKYEHGIEKYGEYDPATDPRDFIGEAEAELLDAINYLGMFVMKLRVLGELARGKDD